MEVLVATRRSDHVGRRKDALQGHGAFGKIKIHGTVHIVIAIDIFQDGASVLILMELKKSICGPDLQERVQMFCKPEVLGPAMQSRKELQKLSGKVQKQLDCLKSRLDSCESRLETCETRLDSCESRVETCEMRLDAQDSRNTTYDANFTEIFRRLDMDAQDVPMPMEE